ncbi:hypothetical protein FHY55_18060 [Oceanicola sp. D3]|uniref:COG3904 family protein n=1 Tax=Oceanicola sp. D3 TaxID=2587163 RepID=UPI00111F6E05|nr:hypothetical protein [Oceanicola sp. D3]QDC11019.1 hypothetical protein FHY55_18060 [Oceanicola sp. D3]
MASFLKQHWRGALPLWLALAGPVACSALLLWAVNRVLADWPLPALALVDAPLAIWAVVGAFRTADRALREGGGFVAGFAAYAGAGAVLLAVGTTLVARKTPVRSFTSETVPARLAVARLPEEAGRLRLEGEMTLAQFNALRERLARGGVVAIDLDSPGGNIFAARGMARLIEEAGLATHAQVRCFSACTLVFAAGAARSVGQEGALGFHRYVLLDSSSYGAVRHVDAAAEEAKDRAFLARRGVARAFLERAYQTPPETLWHPSRAEMREAGLLTD